MKVYRGVRTPKGCVVTVDGAPLDPWPDRGGDAAADFEWGYDGAGPRRLALAILVDFLGDDGTALNHQRTFAEAVIADLKGDEWTLTAESIEGALAHIVAVPMDLKTLLDRARGRRS